MNLDNKSLFILEFKKTSNLDPRYREEALADGRGSTVGFLRFSALTRVAHPRARAFYHPLLGEICDITVTPARELGNCTDRLSGLGSGDGRDGSCSIVSSQQA